MKFVFIITLLVGLIVNAQSFEPGLWKSEESLKIAGIPLPSTSDEECIDKTQAKDAKATIAKELKRKGCSLDQWSVVKKVLDAKITCKNDDLDAKGELRGPFTKTKYELSGKAHGTYKGAIPAVAELKLSGEWVKTQCKKK
jgi:hypothetical protein